MTYFYFMTAIGPDGAPVEMRGIVNPVPGSTRASIYQELRESARAALECSHKQVRVTSFSLEPNEVTL